MLTKLLRCEVKSKTATNIIQAKKYSEILGNALLKYKNRSIETVQVIEELIQMAKRMFLERIGIEKHITIHTLRACFATHLLATGSEPLKVMRMGGWSDLKTFQIYIRMAGVDVKGLTDNFRVMLEFGLLDNVIKHK